MGDFVQSSHSHIWLSALRLPIPRQGTKPAALIQVESRLSGETSGRILLPLNASPAKDLFHVGYDVLNSFGFSDEMPPADEAAMGFDLLLAHD